MKTLNVICNMVSADYSGQEVDLVIKRGWTRKEGSPLSDETAVELMSWTALLDELVPNDFEYFVDFFDGKYLATLEFSNGLMCGTSGDFPVSLNKNVRRNLIRFDWNKFRGDCIQMTEVVDEAVGQSSGPLPKWFIEHVKAGKE